MINCDKAPSGLESYIQGTLICGGERKEGVGRDALLDVMQQTKLYTL